MKVAIQVLPREGLADPQSQTVRDTLHRLGFSKVETCSIGRWMTVDINTQSKDEALNQARLMCDKLLTNPIMEDAVLTVVEGENSR